jgi:hypothetical protein
MQENTARPVPGSCLCGAVRFQASLPTLFCAHCHCSMCRRNHGAAFVTWFAVPKSQFKIVDGGDRLVRYASSSHGTRTFCGTCGSSLFCESTQHPEKIDVVLANMEGRIDREPQLHVYYSDRAAWATLEDDLPRLGGATGLEPLAGDPTVDDEV